MGDSFGCGWSPWSKGVISLTPGTGDSIEVVGEGIGQTAVILDRAEGTGAPVPSASVLPVAMPKGVWTGETLLAWTWYSIRVTLPARCVEGERCGREKLIPKKRGDACGGPWTLVAAMEDGRFLFDSPVSCPPIEPILTG
jgi:hypothetical protein